MELQLHAQAEARRVEVQYALVVVGPVSENVSHLQSQREELVRGVHHRRRLRRLRRRRHHHRHHHHVHVLVWNQEGHDG